MAPTEIWLITGASRARGIGAALVTKASRHCHFHVVFTVRKAYAQLRPVGTLDSRLRFLHCMACGSIGWHKPIGHNIDVASNLRVCSLLSEEVLLF